MNERDFKNLSEFQVGSVLSLAWRTLFAAPGIFIGLTFAATLLSTVFGVLGRVAQQGTLAASLASLLFVTLNMILSVLIQGAIAYSVFRVIVNKRVTVGESLSQVASKFPALIALAVLMSIGIGFGFILLLIPGLILLCMWYVSATSCVVERLGPIESFGRSRELTKGHRLKILGILAALGIFIGLAYAISAFLANMLFIGNESMRYIVPPIVTGLGGLIPTALMNVASGVIYYSLRVVKENLTMESLADVFD